MLSQPALSRLVAILFVLVSGLTGVAKESDSINVEPGKQLPNQFSLENHDGETVAVNYLVFVPDNYNEESLLPLMLFMHGRGESGDDLEKVKQWGPPKIVASRTDFPFILVSPQSPEKKRWNPKYMEKLLAHVKSKLKVDANRVYVTGLSMGGEGTWGLLNRAAGQIAAALPVCGPTSSPIESRAARAKEIGNVPLWVFHGDADSVVDISHSEKMLEALKANGVNAKFTAYEGVNHNSWSKTYSNPEIYEWLLSHTLDQRPLRFEMQVLTIDTNEGCDIGDIDGDGKLDVVAGRNWFRNGDWLPRPIRTFGDKNGYAESNADFVYDVNKDGKLDVIAGGFFDADIHWYENPGNPKLNQGHLWTKHKLATTTQTSNEFTMMHDFDGDGVPEWVSNSWVKTSPLKIWRMQEDKDKGPMLKEHAVGPVNGHGMGFGDINNDGLTDILVGAGWYEGTKDGPFSGKWKLHSDWDHKFSCPMLVRDIDGDGANDVVWGNPHDFGLYVWFGRGMKDGKWTYEEKKIDNSFSQAHCIHFADIDGDGRDDIVSGKRVRAHNGNDPGAGDPPVICYFTMNDKQEFKRNVIHRGQAGIGLQIRSADIDADGDVDLVCAGKDGTEIFFNQRIK